MGTSSLTLSHSLVSFTLHWCASCSGAKIGPNRRTIRLRVAGCNLKLYDIYRRMLLSACTHVDLLCNRGQRDGVLISHSACARVHVLAGMSRIVCVSITNNSPSGDTLSSRTPSYCFSSLIFTSWVPLQRSSYKNQETAPDNGDSNLWCRLGERGSSATL